MKRKKPTPEGDETTPTPLPPDVVVGVGDDDLESDGEDILAEVLKRGTGAVQKRRRQHQRIGLPLDTPFRIAGKSLGLVRLHRLQDPPYGYLRILPSVWGVLEREVPRFRIFLGTSLRGEWFVFATPQSGFVSGVAAAELTAVARAVGKWTVVGAPVQGSREVVACRDYGAPLFPARPAKDLVAEAFEGRTVSDYDDPRIDALAGRFDEGAE